MSGRLWVAVIRFAARRLPPPNRRPVGLPGQRDPAAPCDQFWPRAGQLGERNCAGDGHYLCTECAFLRAPTDEE